MGTKIGTSLADILETEVDEKYFLSEAASQNLLKNQSGQCQFDGSTTLIFGKDGNRKNQNYASCLTGGGHSGGNHSDMDLVQFSNPSLNNDDTVTAIDASYYKGVGRRGNKYRAMATDKNRIRRLTPIECERLQGFPDDWTKYGLFENEVKEISDTQRYKTCGNAVTVNVIEAIVTAMIEKGCLS